MSLNPKGESWGQYGLYHAFEQVRDRAGLAGWSVYSPGTTPSRRGSGRAPRSTSSRGWPGTRTSRRPSTTSTSSRPTLRTPPGASTTTAGGLCSGASQHEEHERLSGIETEFVEMIAVLAALLGGVEAVAAPPSVVRLALPRRARRLRSRPVTGRAAFEPPDAAHVAGSWTCSPPCQRPAPRPHRSPVPTTTTSSTAAARRANTAHRPRPRTKTAPNDRPEPQSMTPISRDPRAPERRGADRHGRRLVGFGSGREPSPSAARARASAAVFRRRGTQRSATSSNCARSERAWS